VNGRRHRWLGAADQLHGERRDQEAHHVDHDGAGRADRLQQQAAEARPAHVRRRLGGEQLAVGVGEAGPVGDDHRDVRRVRHVEQHAERPREQRHHHEVRHRQRVRERRRGHGGEQRGPAEIGEDQ
jgi:hypothetical protein